MWNIFRNKKDDKLADLLINLLEDGGVESFTENQAIFIVREQEKARIKSDNSKVYEKFLYLDRLNQNGKLEDKYIEEYDYVKFLVEARGLGDDK